MATPAANSITQNVTGLDGVVSAYWLVKSVLVDVPTMTLTVFLNGYLTVAGQQAGQGPSNQHSCTASGGAFAGIVAGGGNLLNAIAVWLVANDATFAGGTVN